MKHLWTIAAACIFLSACGSDSSSSSDDELDPSESSEETSYAKNSSASGKSSSSKEREDPNDPEDYVKTSTKVYYLDSVWDVNNKQYISTVQFGTYIWMAENVSKNESNSICYDNDSDNCKRYSRLYMQRYAKDVCPTGFHVPSVVDWKDLDNFRSQSSKMANVLDLTFDGYCDTDIQNEISCSEINKTGKYITSSGKAYTIRKGESKTSFTSINKQSYYSLRCVAYSHIVGSMKELPTCDSASRVSLGTFYVTQEKTNFRCSGSRWTDDNTDDCSYSFEGFRAKYNDSLYICKNDRWQLADIRESRDSCTSELNGTLLIFNGKHYACENRSWRVFTNLENELGYCNKKKLYDIDTLEYGSAYICDTTGWRTTTIADYAGKCTEAKQDREFEFENYYYLCSDSVWKQLTGLNVYFGRCDDRRRGQIGNNPIKDYTYICDSTGWRTASISEVGGTCDMASIDKEILFNNANYYCTGNVWRKDSTGLPKKHCLTTNIGKRDSSYQIYGTDTTTAHFICDSAGWKKLYGRDLLLGICSSKIDSTIKTYKDTTFACINGSWTTTLAINGKFGFCTSALQDSIRKNEDTTYVCRSNRWSPLSQIEKLLGVCTAAIDSTIKTSADTATYACLNGGWKKLTFPENEYGFCTSKNDSTIIENDTTFYRCANNKWVYASSVAGAYPCNKSNDSALVTFHGTTYRCYGSRANWETLYISEVVACNNSNRGDTLTYRNSLYVCKTSSWTLVTDLERRIGICKNSIISKVVQDDDSYYRCETGMTWKRISEEEVDLGVCGIDTSFYKMLYPDKWYQCSKGSWTKATSVSQVFGNCSFSSYMSPKEVSLYGRGYVCDSTTGVTSWTNLTALDSVMGYCNTARLGKTFITDSALYKCTLPKDRLEKKWTKVNLFNYMGECTSKNIGEKKNNLVNTSICTNVGWTSNDTSTYTDTRDNHKYGYISINGTNWMTSNMTYANVDSTWCPEGCEKNGRLYAYTTAQTVCPSGWRLPTTKDWTDLLDYVSEKDTSYKYLAFSPYYGIRLSNTQFLDFLLQNGSDPMTKIFDYSYGYDYYSGNSERSTIDSLGHFQSMWTLKGDSLKMFPKNDAYGDGTEKGCVEGCQYQYRKTIGLPVRCIRK